MTLDAKQLDAIAKRAAELVTTTPAASPWLNAEQAAEHLACDRERIYDLSALGKLQPRYDGRRPLFRREDLDAYLESA